MKPTEPAGMLSRRMLLLAWLPVLAISLVHYVTGPDYHWLHDVLRRLYYLPILAGAFGLGLRGGLGVAGAAVIVYSPHAFTHLVHMDPAYTLEKALEILLYLVVGGVAGGLVDREHARQLELEATAEKLQASLAEQRRTLEQLIRAGRLAALGELVAGIAHEIKNPLHTLSGTAEVVDGVVPRDAPERRMWELHLRELRRLRDVAERFLTYARPSPLHRKEVDLRQLAQHTVELVASQARQQGATVELVSGGAPRVEADEGQLTQVLLNITLNALQALGPEGGRVTYEIAEEQRGGRSFALLRVWNGGPPIEAENLERIFDPFVTTKDEGVGLGLSIASRIVEQHGGFLEAENTRNPPGVRFSVLLPHNS